LKARQILTQKSVLRQVVLKGTKPTAGQRMVENHGNLIFLQKSREQKMRRVRLKFINIKG
jgi:hypothetical protein